MHEKWTTVNRPYFTPLFSSVPTFAQEKHVSLCPRQTESKEIERRNNKKRRKNKNNRCKHEKPHMEIETHNLKIPGNVPAVAHVLARRCPGNLRGQQIVLFCTQLDKLRKKVKSAVSEN